MKTLGLALLCMSSAIAQPDAGHSPSKPALTLDTQLTEIVETPLASGQEPILTLGLGETSTNSYPGIYSSALDKFKSAIPENNKAFTSPEIITHFGRPQSEIPLNSSPCNTGGFGAKKTLFYLIKATGRPKTMAVFNFCNNLLESHSIKPIP